ncbi:MAG: SH3 domain-containing protein [Chloroflexi bacterium]|jgi:hypothetical protein|nr:SH3 domain-containing protein [Chloroflexota bacterium]
MKKRQFAIFFLLSLSALLLTFLLAPPHIGAADSRWRARYWNNRKLSGDPDRKRDEDAINYDWGDGSPSSEINNDDFSARWTRNVYFNTGTYRFTATMDDGMRVWVDDTLIIDSWTDSQVHSTSSDMVLTAGDHAIKVEYYEVGGKAVAKFSWASIAGLPPVPTDRWRGAYFNNMTLTGQPALVRESNEINFDWKLGSPASSIQSDQFSARWRRDAALNTGLYRFTVLTDDGVRLWVNGHLLIDKWRDNQSATYSADMALPGGSVPMQLDYYENEGAALVKLTITELQVGIPVTPQPSPTPAPGNKATVVNAQTLNVRSEPEMGDNIIGVAFGGQVVIVLDRHGGWVKVRLPNGLVGWVGSSYLAFAG